MYKRQVNNGCDLNCGSAFLHLKDAYDKGLVSDEAITAAVERLMAVSYTHLIRKYLEDMTGITVMHTARSPI